MQAAPRKANYWELPRPEDVRKHSAGDSRKLFRSKSCVVLPVPFEFSKTIPEEQTKQDQEKPSKEKGKNKKDKEKDRKDKDKDKDKEKDKDKDKDVAEGKTSGMVKPTPADFGEQRGSYIRPSDQRGSAVPTPVEEQVLMKPRRCLSAGSKRSLDPRAVQAFQEEIEEVSRIIRESRPPQHDADSAQGLENMIAEEGSERSSPGDGARLSSVERLAGIARADMLMSDSSPDDDSGSPRLERVTFAGKAPNSEDVLRKYLQPNGVLSTFRFKNERDSVLRRAALKKYVESRKMDTAMKAKAVDESKARLERAIERASELQMEYEMFEPEVRQLEQQSQGAIKPPALAPAQHRLATLEAICADQWENVRKESVLLYTAERELDLAETEQWRIEDLEKHLSTLDATDQFENQVLSQYRISKEVDAAVAVERRLHKKKKKLQLLQQAEEERITQALLVADEAHRAAVERVKIAQKHVRDCMEKLEAQKKAQKEKQVQAILELKKHMDDSSNAVKAAVERKRKKRQAQLDAEERERADILAAGGNPYEKFRRRKEEGRKEAVRKKLAENKRHKELEIAEKLMEEERRLNKQMEAQDAHKAHLTNYQKEVGRKSKEARTVAYLQTRTKGNVDIIDPSSKQAILLPSQFTVVKDWKFGLGKSTPAVLEKISHKYPHETFNPLLVPKSLLAPDRDPLLPTTKRLDGVGPGAGIRGDDAPGADVGTKIGSKQDADDALGEEVHAVPEFKGLWSKTSAAEPKAAVPGVPESESASDFSDSSSVSGSESSSEGEGEGRRRGRRRKGPHQLSVLERRMMEEAKVAHVRRIQEGSPQVVWGKEWEGDPFLSKPPRLVFLDFEPGGTYRQRISLTNVSYTFNTFKILPLPDSLRDFFEVQYKPPGQMSAGLSVHVVVKFQPKVNEDIDHQLVLQTATGRMTIPLLCYTKKVKISVVGVNADRADPSYLQLEPVVLGETVNGSIQIINNGALATLFHILDNPPDAAPTPISDQFNNQVNVSTASGSQVVTPDAAIPPVASSERPPATTSPTPISEAAQRGVTPGEGPDRPASETVSTGRASPSTGRYQTLSLVREGTAKPYSTTTVAVSFKPVDPGQFDFPFLIHFDDPNTPPHHILVKCIAGDVPIYVERSVLDMQVCLYGKLYRDVLLVRNRGKVALRCQTEVPKELRDCLEFVPRMGYAQAGSSFEFQVKFRPEKTLLKQCGPYADDKSSIIEFPLKVDVPDQVLPVQYTFRAQLSSSDLEFIPPELDFGSCSIYESTEMEIKMCNKSILPQKYGFAGLPPEIEIEPGDGFGTILPEETLSLRVAFKPSSAIEYKYQLVCRTLFAREFVVPMKAQGVQPPTRFSHSVVQFAPTALADTSSQSVYITNTLKKDPVAFEFAIPPKAEFKIAPLVDTIPPGRTVRIQIDFMPKVDLSTVPRVPAPAVEEKPPDLLPAAEAPLSSGREPQTSAGKKNRSGSPGKDAKDKEKSQAKGAEKSGKGAASGQAAASAKSGPGRQSRLGSTSRGQSPDGAPIPLEQASEPVQNKGASQSSTEPDLTGVFSFEPDKVVGFSRGEGGDNLLLWHRRAKHSVPCFLKILRDSKSTHGSNATLPLHTRQSNIVEASSIRLDQGPTVPFQTHTTLLAGPNDSQSPSPAVDSSVAKAERPLVTFLQVETVAVMPSLVTDGYRLVNRLDFGVVPLGQRVVKSFTLRNISKSDVEPVPETLCQDGTFLLLNAIRSLAPSQAFTCYVAFCPAQEFMFSEPLVIRSSTNTVSIRLLGQGVKPNLVIEGLDPSPAPPPQTSPESPPERCFDLGDTLPDTPISRTLKVMNRSAFELKFKIHIEVSGHSNLNGLMPFTCSPSEALVAAGAEREVVVTFSADHESDKYKERVKLEVSGMRESTSFTVTGRCWSKAMYFTGGDSPGRSFDNLFDIPIVPAVPQPTAGGKDKPTAALASTSQSSKQPRTTLTFKAGPKQDGAPARTGAAPAVPATSAPSTGREPKKGSRSATPTAHLATYDPALNLPWSRTITIGCAKPANDKDKKNGEYTVDVTPEFSAEGFSVDVAKAPVEAGTKKIVTFSFMPPSQTSVVQAIGMGRWHQAEITCTLRGGFPAPESQEGIKVPITLRAYMGPGQTPKLNHAA